MSKFSASVSINAKSNLKGVTKDIDKGLKKNNKSLKLNAAAWKKAGKAASKFGKIAVASTAAVSVGLLALIKRTANLGDELAKTSEKTGLTVKELQRLRFAAQIGGATTQDLNTGIRIFSRAIDEAAQGTMEYQEAFDRLGISTTDSQGRIRKTVDVLHDVADIFERVEDGAAKTSLAQQLFGRGGSALIPILNEGSDAIKQYGDEIERLGFIISKDQAEASEQFNDDLLRLRAEISALATAIAIDAVPQVNRFINSIRSNLPAIREFVEENIDLAGWLEKIGDFAENIDLKKVFDVSLDKIVTSFESIAASLKELREFTREVRSFDPLGVKAFSAFVGEKVGAIESTESRLLTPEEIQMNIKMEVDQDGRVRSVSTNAPQGVEFQSDLGLMLPVTN